MAQHFNSQVLGEYMRDRVWSALGPPTGASGIILKRCVFGDLEPFPADLAVSTNLPAVFIQPQSMRNDFQTLNERYLTNYTFRILYVDVIPEAITSEVFRLRVERVADSIVDDIRLDVVAGLTLNNAQVGWSIVRSIEYRPPEDNLLASANANVYVSAITWQVQLITWK